MTITNVTDRELAVARQFEALKGVYRRDHETSQAKIEELRAEVAELKAKAEMDYAMIAGDNALIAGLKSDIADLTQQVEILKSKLAEVPVTTAPNPRVIEIYDTCDQHPDAPHGYLRDASHNAGRYVCECEFWTPGEES